MTRSTKAPGPHRPDSDWRRVDAALHRFFSGRVADSSVRADLVQDVLLRMHERRGQLHDDDRLDAWAFRIARNALIDHYRRERPNEALPELIQPEPEPPNDASRVLGAWLRGQLELLAPRYREVLQLTELQGLSQREAATALDMPYSTLKSRVQRGRELLHAELLGCCAVELDARGRITDYEPRSCGPCGCGGETAKSTTRD